MRWGLGTGSLIAAYTVVDGYKVDPETMKGFRTWRAAACDRCHGANQEGLVGPSLVNSLKTLTKDEFIQKTSNFYMYKTGLGTNVLLMTVISFIVGLSISGQTFYTFILENLEKFGALKAIGAKGRELIYMILFQATFTSLTGYGLGIGLAALVITLAKLRLPSYAAKITYGNLWFAFVMVLVIAGISSYIGIRKVLKIEPFDIFRG